MSLLFLYITQELGSKQRDMEAKRKVKTMDMPVNENSITVGF